MASVRHESLQLLEPVESDVELSPFGIFGSCRIDVVGLGRAVLDPTALRPARERSGSAGQLRHTMTIDLPASRQFAAWLSAFNSGRQAEMLTYHEAKFPYDKASADVAGIDRELGLSQFAGGFELKRAEESAATGTVAILKERDSDQFARAAMDVDAEPPHHVLKFEIHSIPTPDDLRPCRMEERDAIVALVTEIDRAMQRDWFSGAVLIAKKGRRSIAEAFGFADRAAKLPNTLNTRFRIASIDKMFTAVAIMRLYRPARLPSPIRSERF